MEDQGERGEGRDACKKAFLFSQPSPSSESGEQGRRDEGCRARGNFRFYPLIDKREFAMAINRVIIRPCPEFPAELAVFRSRA